MDSDTLMEKQHHSDRRAKATDSFLGRPQLREPVVLRGRPLSGSSPAPSKAFWVALQSIPSWQRKQAKQLGKWTRDLLDIHLPNRRGIPKARPQHDNQGQHSPFPLLSSAIPPQQSSEVAFSLQVLNKKGGGDNMGRKELQDLHSHLVQLQLRAGIQ